MKHVVGKKRRQKVVINLVFFCILSILISGCDKYTRYKALTFFFTGVPPVDQTGILSQDKGAKLAASEKQKRELPQEISLFVHGPYGAGQCNLCHEGLDSVSFRPSAKEKLQPKARPSFKQGFVPGRLALPLKELCIDCHINKSVQSAFTKNLWMHGPVSDGLCIRCHDPHQSPYEFMLVKDKTIDLCTQCHAKGFITEIKEHTEGKECTSCHNAHTGKNRFLLKKDYIEIF